MLNRELLASQVIAEYSWQHFCGRILEKLRIETDTSSEDIARALSDEFL